MGSFSQTAARRLRGVAPRPRPASMGPARQLALADGRKLWVTRVPGNEWGDLQPGDQLLLVRAHRRHLPDLQALELAEVLENKLRHPAAPALALLWGGPPERGPDTRPATVLHRRELAVLLRYEVRETGCPDVVATLLPFLN